MDDERFDLSMLDEEDPFEIDTQAAHLFKHPHLGIDDIDAPDAVGLRPSPTRKVSEDLAREALGLTALTTRKRALKRSTS